MSYFDAHHILFFIVGCVITFVFMRYFANARIVYAEQRAKEIIELAEKESELQVRQRLAANDLAIERSRSQSEKEMNKRQHELEEWEIRLDKQAREIRLERGSIKRRELELVERRQSVDQSQFEYRKRLESLSKMGKAEALEALKVEIREECAQEIADMRQEILSESEESIKEKACRIMVDTLHRFSSDASADISATLIKLPNEEMKGRIIGREGRNIHSFEAATGTTLMIDETPESVLVSSFDPVRREIAKIALEELVKDGRIHPGTIEDEVQKAKDAIQENAIKLGEDAAQQLKIKNLDKEITELLGKLHFYLSNNQRTLEHSIETAYICSIMASEIGLNPDIAKRAGLFHDIGKAMSHEYEGSHARAGALLLKSHGELPIVVNAVEAHHDEVPMESAYAVLVQIADTLSSTRPGARNETMDGYIQRVDNLEKLALSFAGVNEAYALRAGRELRVIVDPVQMTDTQAASLARRVRQRIEESFNYPGTIQVTVVREQRFKETAT